MAAISTSVISGGGIFSLLSAGGLILGLIKEIADYKKETSQLKENSMYFLWKLKKQQS